MGETGKKDKGKKEQKKKPKMTIKEKRKAKHEKEQSAQQLGVTHKKKIKYIQRYSITNSYSCEQLFAI